MRVRETRDTNESQIQVLRMSVSVRERENESESQTELAVHLEELECHQQWLFPTDSKHAEVERGNSPVLIGTTE